ETGTAGGGPGRARGSWVTLTVTGPQIARNHARPDPSARQDPVAAHPVQPAAAQSVQPAAAHPIESVHGVAPWIRCFAEELHAPRFPVQQMSDRPWRVRRARDLPFDIEVDGLFRDDPGADQVLAIIGDPAEQESCVTAVRAAQEA